MSSLGRRSSALFLCIHESTYYLVPTSTGSLALLSARDGNPSTGITIDCPDASLLVEINNRYPDWKRTVPNETIRIGRRLRSRDHWYKGSIVDFMNLKRVVKTKIKLPCSRGPSHVNEKDLNGTMTPVAQNCRIGLVKRRDSVESSSQAVP